ncbi:MAG TPA: hypothetical protein VNU68_34815 [Verrucomicrobiae bacterium]|nr:hypothetical protein [Verrucomicrobiae bacterium]
MKQPKWNEEAWAFKGYTQEERAGAEATFNRAMVEPAFRLWYLQVEEHVTKCTPGSSTPIIIYFNGYFNEADDLLRQCGWGHKRNDLARAVNRFEYAHPDNNVRIIRAEGAFIITIE